MSDKPVHQLDQIRNEWYGHESMKWYGWGSPIGLSIFFLAIVAMAAIVKIIFFG